MNQSNDTKLHKVSIAVLVALGCLAAPNIYAQETDSLLEEEDEEVTEAVERVTVTGSRIKRQEFSNASPIQVISGDISRELGLFDTNDMLQNTTQASGTQIDSTFNGFVLDNGPGAATVGFRGLGADRTLVLVNGRRVAPAGVGGAPTAPDLNLIPSILIDRIENLFDGASTVYGSDAIAGVANVILKSNVDGFEFNASATSPGEGGEQTALALMYGATGDNYSITVAGEYNNRERQTLGESAFNSSCEELIYEGDDGEIYRGRRGDGPSAKPISNCQIFPLTNRMSIPFFGSVYRTEGFSNIGLDNWSESTTNPANVGYFQSIGVNVIDVDSNGDGINDTAIFDGNDDGFLDFNIGDPLYSFLNSDYRNSQDFVSPLERISLYVNGDYLLQDDNDTRFFYEGLYAQRDSSTFNGTGQIFPIVSASNPFNICGSDPINGGDCGAAVGVPLGASSARPILNIKGDRQNNAVDAYQYRLVGGVSGNIGALDDFGQGAWSYEVSAIYSASKGESSQVGISSTNFANSLETAVRNVDGSITCGNGSDGCVPVNLFSSNIYQEGGGRFTQEEADYLFTVRNIVTEVKQSMLTGFITGDLFTLPWNDEVVPIVIGAEFRKDEIITDANSAAVDGLYNSFADQGADGSKNLREVFFETEFALLRGEEWAEELTFTASGRVTDETFYAPERTFSFKGIWRPTEWLTVRGTRGTSYRTPNLRERFLNGTSGFNTLTDPCVVPDAARLSDPLDPNGVQTYDPTEDERNERVFASCANNGLDATALGLNDGSGSGFTNFVSAEVTTGGSETLSAETSVSETYGFIFEQPFTDAFDLTLSATWYNIEIRGAVAEPSSGFLVASCYDNEEVPDGSSALCGNIIRDPASQQMTNIDRSFINIGFESSKGIDFNVYYQQDVLVGDNELGITVDLLATKLDAREVEFFGTFDDNVGEINNPEWRATSQLRLDYMDFRFNWSARFVGKGQNDNLFEFDPDGQPCTGIVASCRPLEKTKNYTIHTLSGSYGQDNWAVTAGVRNVFDKSPPLIDGDAGGFQQRNVPLGAGYDIFGRTVFASVNYTF
jgi:iron complex outermembrane receptor protein